MTLSIPYRVIFFPILLTILFFLFVTAAFAQDATRGARPATDTAEGRLRACEARQSAVKQKLSQLTRMAMNMLSKFDAIATRVQNHYTETLVPDGKTVTNYDSLVADINAKKAAVVRALTSAQAGVNNFSCTSPDPKAQITQFRKDMVTVKATLHDYRTSIKNLIVAIRSVTGEMKRDK